ncbi:NEDD8 ultimate buster 1-like [Xenia sp. Carnegie-2017]|uniref:NEDD8 ultimate buster 1-like n=1 Tax=Xenia sp. Carnegie-2017 TaxID=2897299 RepID=UPI001F04608A|nr:NEDD8 ultimate buster 1-like [Xenia sp. Carnegie-2017]
MAIFNHSESVEVANQNNQANPVTKTRNAASVLANKTQGGKSPYQDYLLEISDQNGKRLQLPEDERKSLVLAMTLHEQGRRMAEQRQYADALPLFLAAEEEFRQCRSEVLNAVDNYAILCLDVVWCYLQLQSIRDLPNADELLKKCEKCLKKSYGENLERLVSLTGGSAKEKVLYLRLNLLQAISAFHKGDMRQASRLLVMVEQEVNQLKIDDGSLSQMISMGFGASESRLALRSCNGDVTVAVDYISKKREAKRKLLKERKEKRKKHKMAVNLGKTANGEWVKIDLFNRLCEMGYRQEYASEALRQTNNDMDTAIQILIERPELLERAVSERRPSLEISDELIAQVTSMGFNVDISRSVLKHYGDINKTIGRLLETSGELPPECKNTIIKDGIVADLADQRGGENSDSDSDDPEVVQNALKEITPAFDVESDEAHLDVTLEEEITFLRQYREMIMTKNQWEKRDEEYDFESEEEAVTTRDLQEDSKWTLQSW